AHLCDVRLCTAWRTRRSRRCPRLPSARPRRAARRARLARTVHVLTSCTTGRTEAAGTVDHTATADRPRLLRALPESLLLAVRLHHVVRVVELRPGVLRTDHPAAVAALPSDHAVARGTAVPGRGVH